MNKYSNTKATLAIAVASFRSIIRSPSAVVFSLAFPLIFIIVFANIGSSAVTVDVGVAKTCDTTGPVYQVLKNVKVVHLITSQSGDEMAKNLAKGNIDAIINIQKNNGTPPYTLNIQYTEASQQKGGILKSLLNSIFYQIISK
ncbi:MAG: type transport system permease protein, partial [Mucilaginibacter sp.]|nr:type transport system permease protein [Mucilaginibacter sp.]